MEQVIVAAGIWVISHLGLSSTRLRPLLVNRVGEQGFLGIYSLVAFASLGYLIWAYIDAQRFEYFWLPNIELNWIPKLTMPIATTFLMGGFLVSNPTMVGAQLSAEQAADSDVARGVTRITRHPFQWAVIIWGLGHIAANGDQVSVVFFASFVLLSLLGSILLDKKKAQSLGAAWQAYAAKTSNVPFLAIATGRNKLAVSELWLPIVVGIVTYAVLYYFHESFTGAVVV